MTLQKVTSLSIATTVSVTPRNFSARQWHHFKHAAQIGAERTSSYMRTATTKKRAAFEASLNPDGTVTVARKVLGFFRHKHKETMPLVDFADNLVGFFQRTQLPKSF